LGSGNTSIGAFSLVATDGSWSATNTVHDCVAIGNGSQLYNSGNVNISVGNYSLMHASAGDNVAIGNGSLMNSTSGAFNIAIGNYSLISKTGGDSNISIGHSAGSSLTSGWNNILIGGGVQTSYPEASGEINIGDVYKANSSQITLNKDVEMVGGQKVKYSAKSQNYTLMPSDYVVAVSNLSASKVMTLPSASSMGAGKLFIIKDQSGTASQSNYIQILPQSGEFIDGGSDYKVKSPYESVMLVSNGSSWFII